MSSHSTPIRRADREVQLQLALAAERHHRRDRDEAARAPVEARTRPDLAPGIPGEELLELAREVGRARRGGIDVLVAVHLAAHAHALLIPVVCHGTSPARWRSTASANAAGWLALARWAQSSRTTSRASGIPSASSWPRSGGATVSSAAEMTRVGANDACAGARSRPTRPGRRSSRHSPRGSPRRRPPGTGRQRPASPPRMRA